MKAYFLPILIVLLGLSGCATAPDDNYSNPRDPFEEFNREAWDFNQSLDDYVVWPVARTYGKIPQPVRTGLLNAAENLGEPSHLLNNTLQGKFKDAGVSFWRFLINSTVGVLGVFDVATPMGLTVREEAFGQTLAVWGVSDGPYLMLPALGPTVPVDRGGDVVDGLYFPLDDLNSPLSIARLSIKLLEKRLQLQEQQALMQNSLDPYSFVREAYFQNWRDQVYDGNPPAELTEEEGLEDLGDDFYDQFDD
ncbi:VacJ family lipoprotein [Pseudidiomarina terrestris]|uniref:VacJ family lipoprotein n=1 Tax=Pseudidiomarina terrestris TaxID=2820060 RepID=A0AAW7R0H3_9GAMM|nr:MULTISPECIES: VacJ family lipoprotein [unclassified Pseudidiomarina]MDN7124620.1 VacJ family lipoprotein [Pseudidiomarina sp. 1APP75-32.1]MDN7126834.1 VacJ family lipoprotein [Pseudidiomarina sp. 1APR75-33.1]MDN7129089.1 VacJ family lipoprotein [Pseudidiomarina sp. 1APR75-15]MDN7134647.1 VacJ family lipoprotein [Pseudidiomarina sp. 1ASP75-5]MDN7136683.1 VacJ family lipoprotein [Pseudidiomarina sp. 1ASP75-14]